MGEIVVEGLGIVELKGDNPDERELRAILGAFPDDDAPEPVIAPQEGLSDGLEPEPTVGEPQKALPSRTGIVPQGIRGRVRQAVEDQPGLLQFLTELSPSAGGAALGAAAGAPLGPPGILAGGIIGGVAGEFLGQETGIAPRSNVNLALAGGGPLIGRGVAAVVRGTGRLAGRGFTGFPPMKTARARVTARKSFEGVESFGSRVLSEQQGLMARSASDLYRAVRRSGVTIRAGELPATRNAISELIAEIEPVKAFPEARQAMRLLQTIENTLTGKRTVEKVRTLDIAGFELDDLTKTRLTELVSETTEKEISFDTFIRIRQLVGAAVGRAESAAGIKLGKAKAAFSAISDDLETLARKQKTSRPARLAKVAVQRAKLEFAVRDVERIMARFSKPIAGQEGSMTLNAKGMLKELTDLTNPKSKKFDKNIVNALGKELTTFKSRLNALAKIGEGSGSPAGPGSIVVRGIGARAGRSVVGALTGGAVGLGAGGPVGAAVGGLAGASLPEMLTAMFMSRPGFAVLETAARLGRGQVSQRAWILAGQIVTRAAAAEGKESPLDEGQDTAKQ